VRGGAKRATSVPERAENDGHRRRARSNPNKRCAGLLQAKTEGETTS
jgi:hypothetical protein